MSESGVESRRLTTGAAPLLTALVGALLVALPLLLYSHLITWERLNYVFRLLALDQALREGVLYPRWFPDFAQGFGYPLLNFYSPLSVYLAEPFYALTHSPLVAVSAAQVAMLLLAAGGMFALVRADCPPWPAAAAAAAYVASFYELQTYYLRGHLPEALAASLLPWALLAARRCVEAPTTGRIATLAAAVAALVLSHNTTALLFAPALLVYLALWGGRGFRVARPPVARPLRGRHPGPQGLGAEAATAAGFAGLAAGLAGAALGLGLAAFFWLPALAESRFVRTAQVLEGGFSFPHHFVHLSQLWALTGERLNSLDVGGIAGGHSDHYAFIGAVQLLLAGLSLAAFRRRPDLRRQLIFFWALFAAGIFFATPASAPLWRNIPGLAYALFPWRLLLFSTLSAAWLAGVALAALDRSPNPAPQKTGLWLAAGLGLVLLAPTIRVLVQTRPVPPDTLLRLPALLGLAALYVAASRTGRPTPNRVAQIAGLAAIALALAAWGHFVMGVPRERVRTVRLEDVRAYEQQNPELLGTTTAAEYLPRWTHGRVPLPLPAPIVCAEGGRVEGYQQDARGARAVVITPADAAAVAGIFYFPGWQAYVDGRPSQTEPDPEGLIQFALPRGRHTVELRLEDTPVRSAADRISLLALLGVVALLGLEVNRIRRRRGRMQA